MPSPSVSSFTFPLTTEPVFSASTSKPVFKSPNHTQPSQTTQSQQLQQYHTTTVSPPLFLYELSFHKEVSGARSFTLNYLIGTLKLSKSPKFLKGPNGDFSLASYQRTYGVLALFRVSLLSPLTSSSMGGLGQAK
ncbi:hypothetical protein Tco_0588767 [Tanacetum coccineum]